MHNADMMMVALSRKHTCCQNELYVSSVEAYYTTFSSRSLAQQIIPSFPDTQAKSISTFLNIYPVCLLSDGDSCYTVTRLLKQD